LRDFGAGGCRATLALLGKQELHNVADVAIERVKDPPHAVSEFWGAQADVVVVRMVAVGFEVDFGAKLEAQPLV
jgi:hypothetical protein